MVSVRGFVVFLVLYIADAYALMFVGVSPNLAGILGFIAALALSAIFQKQISGKRKTDS
jgi:hypothetical protein